MIQLLLSLVLVAIGLLIAGHGSIAGIVAIGIAVAALLGIAIARVLAHR